MAIRLDKPWRELTIENLESVKGQLGVFQLGSSVEGVVFIGYAGARSLFGLKGVLNDILALGKPTCFRLEVTSAYQTRYRELLMVHFADHQAYPRDNKPDDLPRLGRLSP